MAVNDKTTEVVAVVEKPQVFSKGFEEEYNERVKIALKDLSPRIIKAVEMFGIITENGYYLEHQGVHFWYEELYKVIKVDLGANPAFRVNLGLKVVTTFRNGSWLKVFEDFWKTRVEGRDYGVYKQRSETRVRDQMGMSKI
jgi:hypothetical protein